MLSHNSRTTIREDSKSGSRPDRRVRFVLARFLAAVGIVSGILLVAEAVVTLVWQEPVSAYLASRSQAGLDDDFHEAKRALREDLATAEASTRTKTPDEPTIGALAKSQATDSGVSEALGRIKLPVTDKAFTFVQGADEGSLRKGPGHYVQTELPGEGGTVAIAGHRTTYLAPFREIDQLEPGDEIAIRMPYGDFRYKVTGTEIVDPSEIWVLGDVDHERLVLSACHPLYSAAERIVVFAKLDAQPKET